MPAGVLPQVGGGPVRFIHMAAHQAPSCFRWINVAPLRQAGAGRPRGLEFMCGIAGFVGATRTVGRDTLLSMRDVMAHRGPDAAGIVGWSREGAASQDEGEPLRAGLAHRRLSIIDLSDAGAQPMCNEDGSIWIVYNGEFYNFGDYRRELEARGHVFRSHCDTETILHLFEEYGLAGTLQRMNGMFAFGLWDTRSRQLILARDRAGKKPLYYVHLPDGSLLFASEIKALLASGMVDASDFDEVALEQIWALGYTTGERTLYRQVRRLEAAHYLVWSETGITVREYWDCPFGVDVWRDRQETDLADELEALLTDAIRIRLVADVPVGLFLSGGIDSSLVAALAVRSAGRQIHSYTIGFPHADVDEAGYAEKIAATLGIENHRLIVQEDILDHAAEIARQFDEPFGDSSAVPTWVVSKLARRFVTVALTGDGGDETFAGYDFQHQAVRIWGSRAERRNFRRPLTLQEHLWEFAQRARGFRRGYPSLERRAPLRLRDALFERDFLQRSSLNRVFENRWRWRSRVRSADTLSQIQYLMFKTWLPDDFLRKVDTSSMAHSLECRCPLLDYRVIEFAARLPFSAKISRGGRGKHLLRVLLARHVPPALFERPKQGFTVPWERYCRGAVAARLQAQWRASARPPFRPEAADHLFPADRMPSNFASWTAFATMSFASPAPEAPGSNG